jgi:hypothetical protein
VSWQDFQKNPVTVVQMNKSWLVAVVFLAVGLVLSAGCTAPAGTINASENASSAPVTIAASYRATINQPDTQSGYVKMDTDIYNIGEVVEFIVINDGRGTLSCAGDPPAFSVKTQMPGGSWTTKMGPDEPNRTVQSSLAPGASTQRYAFVTTGWEPGRYRIVQDCGVEHEFLLRTLPAVTPAPEVCPAINATNASTSSPSVTIDPIGDMYVNQLVSISGTTTLPAGDELKYSIFPASSPDGAQETSDYFTTLVQEGSCGVNTWSAEGVIMETGDYVIWISDNGRNTTAIKRFTVLPES